ncbi:MAG: hypothetical protein KME64_26405 [Scytonematopsis contorta HA4267-MV1]|nr:hypothetical protein [Scytonematopsis contorta HA4267-MV1]
MSESTVSVSLTTRETLQKLADASGESIQVILDKAIENYRRVLFLTDANKSFAALKANETAWQEELGERQEWDKTSSDGLEEV